jgi:hypothetical protein
MDLGSIIDSYGLACPLEVWIDIEVMQPRKTILNPNSSRARYVFPETHLLMQLSLLYIGNPLVLGVLGFRKPDIQQKPRKFNVNLLMALSDIRPVSGNLLF